MTKTVSLKPVKASAANNNGKPPPGDKTLGVDPDIRFYEIEDGDKTEEVEESEILVVHYSSLASFNKSLFKRKFPWVEMFYYEVPTMINVICYAKVGVFENMYITSKIDLDISINYT